MCGGVTIGNVNGGENGCRKMHNFALSLTVMGSLKIFLSPLPPPLFFLGGRELSHPLETHAVCFPPFSLTLGLRPPQGEASCAGLCLHPPPQPAQGGEEGQRPWGPRRRVLQGSWAWTERERERERVTGGADLSPVSSRRSGQGWPLTTQGSVQVSPPPGSSP